MYKCNKKILLKFIPVFLATIFISLLTMPPATVSAETNHIGWVTIELNNLVLDYGDDKENSSVTLSEDDGNNYDREMDTDSLGMKEYDSQSVYIKLINNDQYRLITPNGWKISEDIENNLIHLESDDGDINQMWQVKASGDKYVFLNKQSGHYLSFSDDNVIVPSETPTYVTLKERKYTGWDWYFDMNWGKYYLNGVVQKGVISPFRDGSVGQMYTGLAWVDGAWKYYTLGQEDTSYTGLVYCNNGWWYVSNGRLDKSFNGLLFHYDTWWYIKNGKLDKSFSGLTYYNNEWWYINNGEHDKSFTGLSYLNNTWWYVSNGTINKSFTGLVYQNNAWWYVSNGKIDRSFKGLVYKNNAWWYVSNGKIDKSFKGLVYQNNTWWYVNDGKLDKTYTGLSYKNNNWWFVNDGKIDKSFTGLVYQNNAWWYVSCGILDKSYYGSYSYEGSDWFIENGRAVMTESDI